MKRWIASALLVALLCGCSVTDTPASTPPESTPSGTVSTTSPTIPSETTLPAEPEPEPAAWTSYDLDGEYLAAAGFQDNQVLLFGRDKLVLWDLTAGKAVAQLQTENLPLPDSGCVRVSDSGIAYWNSNTNSVIFLDRQLSRTGKLLLDEIPSGDPFLAADSSALYYCTPTGIRVLDFSTGICRSLKIQEGSWLGVYGTLLNGTALRCRLAQPDGTVRNLLISVATGETLYEGDMLDQATDCGELYCCLTEREWIFGYADQRPQTLLVEDAVPVAQIAAALAVTTAEDAPSVLDLYDLASGMRIASVEADLDRISTQTVMEDALWFLDGTTLHRWNYSLTPVEDETVYSALRYTRDDPDTEGLDACQARAEALEALYGIDILLYTDILTVQPGGYSFTWEHLPQVLDAGLTTLEQAMARLPEGFLKKCASWTGDGTLHIALARSVATPAEGVYATIPAMQYLIGTNAYIVLTLDETLESSFYHALAHVADTQVLNNSNRYDQWSTLNPSGFVYDKDYLKNLTRDDSKYLTGSNRYFISTLSMSFPVEDRATLFEYAMMPGNEACFESKYMQAKLKRLTQGLKDAFGLTGSGYAWEQYLQ